MRRPITGLAAVMIAIVIAVGLAMDPFKGPLPVSPVLAATGSGTIAAPNVQVGITSSSMATITLNEGAPADYPAVGTVSVMVSIFDGAGNDRLGFVGTPSVSAPGSLADRTATVGSGVLDNQLTITWASSDVASLEPISVTGLRISAASNAVAGTIRAFYSTSGIPAAYYGAGVWTAAGSLVNPEAVGSTALEVSADVGSFPFAPSGFGNGLLRIAAPSAESVGVIAVLVGPVLTTNPLVFSHAAGTRVTQSVSVAGTLTTLPVTTPAGILTQTASGRTTAVAGSTDQGAGTTRLTESTAGVIVAGTVITYTIATAGVRFTSAPQADPDTRLGVANLSLGAPATCALNAARTSCAVVVTSASTLGPGMIDITGVRLDVATTVPAGTLVGIAASVSPALTVSVVDRTVAVVSASVIATSLSAPGTAASVTTTGVFAIPTRIVATGKYATWKFQLAPAAAGARIEIWVATNTGSGWSAFTRLTTRLTDSTGAAYFWWRSRTAQRISVRGYFAGDLTHSGAWSPARQARWR